MVIHHSCGTRETDLQDFQKNINFQHKNRKKMSVATTCIVIYVAPSNMKLYSEKVPNNNDLTNRLINITYSGHEENQLCSLEKSTQTIRENKATKINNRE